MSHGKSVMERRREMNVCHICVSGRLTSDAAAATTDGGRDVVRFSVARNRRDRDGVETAEFYSCSWFGEYASKAAESLKRGRKVVVEGDFSVRSYERDDGSDGISLDVLVRSCDVVSVSEKSN